MDISIQEEYLKQYSKRKKQEIFAKSSGTLLGECWQLVDTYKTDSEHTLKCEFLHPNGKLCGKRIKNIYTIKSQSGKLLKVGSTCLSYIIDIKKIEKVDKAVEKLHKKIEKIKESNFYQPIKKFSTEERQQLYQQALIHDFIPGDVKELANEGIPLPESVYHDFEISLEILRKNQELLKKEQLFNSKKESYTFVMSNVTNTFKNSQQAVWARLKEKGPYNIETVGDVKKAIVNTIEEYIIFSKKEKIGILKYSELISPIVNYYRLEDNKAAKLKKQFYQYTWNQLKEIYLLTVFDGNRGDFFIRFPKEP